MFSVDPPSRGHGTDNWVSSKAFGAGTESLIKKNEEERGKIGRSSDNFMYRIEGIQSKGAGIRGWGTDIEEWSYSKINHWSTIEEKFETRDIKFRFGASARKLLVPKKSFWAKPQTRVLMDSEQEALGERLQISYNQKTKKADVKKIGSVDVIKKIDCLPNTLSLITRGTVRANAESSQVWVAWRDTLQRSNLDLAEELDFVKQLTKKNTCNPHIWSHRKWVVEKLGTNSARMELRKELEFTEQILSANPKNKYAWSYRQWVLQAFAGWEDETEFSHKILMDDSSNGDAWKERLFLVTSCNPGGNVIDEVNFAIECISDAPENEYPWMYLIGIHKKFKLDSKLDDLFENVLEIPTKWKYIVKDRGLRWPITSDRQRKDEEEFFEMDIYKNSRKYVRAIGALLDLIHYGYIPNYRIQDVITAICPDRICPCHIIKCLYLILRCLEPSRLHYWKWRCYQASDICLGW